MDTGASHQQSISGLVEHLKEVTQNPSISLDSTLLETALSKETIGMPNLELEDVCSQFLEHLDMDQERMLLLHHLSELLPTLQQDPSPAASLVRRLITVPQFSFKKVLEIDPEVNFVAGLKSESVPINTVTVDLLARAKYANGDGDILASMNDVVHLLVRQLLLTENVALQLQIQNLFEDLLMATEHDTRLMWRRVFGDRDIYHTFFWICSINPRLQLDERTRSHVYEHVENLSYKKKSIAQSRLLALLVKIDDPLLRQSYHLGVYFAGIFFLF